MMAAKRMAVWIDADATPASLNAFSWASIQAPQPLIADTASDHSSKSIACNDRDGGREEGVQK
jgi:hypothetical protein